MSHRDGDFDDRASGQRIADLGAALEGFILEHEYCGELGAAVEEDCVWMSCTCGAVINRALEPVA